MARIKAWWWLIFITLFSCVLLFPVSRHRVPLPLDVLVGSYYPWLDYKWGYSVGVPVKNASLSDVISQLYVWRRFAMDTIRQGTWPLWNPYSHSGMPLMANWYSGVFYPLNLLMLGLGNLNGWTAMIFLQLVLSQILMYLFLRVLIRPKIACLAGAATFALSGFMMTNLEYVTVGHTFLWLPAILLVVHRAAVSGRTRDLLYLPFLVFMQLTAGAIFPLVYSFMVCGAYLLYLKFIRGGGSVWLRVAGLIAIGVCLASAQIIPSLELATRSIRFADTGIVEHGYGLLPAGNLAAFIAPDIFGNPATGNFRGFLGYQETSGYFGLAGLFLILVSLPRLLKTGLFRFWFWMAVVFLVLAFANPLSVLVYKWHLPILSASFASRALLPFTFSVSVLVAYAVSLSVRVFFPRWIPGFTAAFLVISGLVLVYHNDLVAVRNLMLPGLVLFLAGGGLLVFKKPVPRTVFLLGLILFDLGRYFFKFTPFSPPEFDYPRTPVIKFLQSEKGYFRTDREKGPVLPPNSQVAYGLATPSGYDPMALYTNTLFYNGFYNHDPAASATTTPVITRYQELTSYSSSGLDLFGVKYLAVLKRDESGKFRPWGRITDSRLTGSRFRSVFTDGVTVVLENSGALPRAMVYTDFTVSPETDAVLRELTGGYDFYHRLIVDKSPQGMVARPGQPVAADITLYTPGEVEINLNATTSGFLVLTDTAYPGWTASVDDQPADILTAFGIFRAVRVSAGSHRVIFKYLPGSFLAGLSLTVFSLILILYLSRQLSVSCCSSSASRRP
jgi:hypothetical protein